MAHEKDINEELAALIRRTDDAAKAYIRGDMRTYFALIRHADDYSLMAPFDGEPTRGFEDPSPERLEALERYFRNGPEWRLVHRHANPLVHGIGLEQLSALARG